MSESLTDALVDEALQSCAAEPIHIPGNVQPFACLLAIDTTTDRFAYASENCAEIFGKTAAELLGQEPSEVLGRDIVHGLNNATAASGFGEKLVSVGHFFLGGFPVEIGLFKSQDMHVLQIEPAEDTGLGGTDALKTLTFLMEQIQTCTDQESLLKLTVELLRHISGYDRVLIYKFDTDHNGEVLSEVRARGMDSFLGLRFPHWDIPAQVREIMVKVPLRMIQDVDQTPVPLIGADASLPPLDISLAACRGVSVIHLQYLRNMGSKATLTLSVVVDGSLWGIISFHHRRPRVPPPGIRALLTGFLGVFSVKLQALQQQEHLRLVSVVDQMKEDLLRKIDEAQDMKEALPHIGKLAEDVLDAVGVSLLVGAQTTNHGMVPGPETLTRLFDTVKVQSGKPLVIENLVERFPDLADEMNGCAGTIAQAVNPRRAICIFRDETAQSVSWAGNPEKTLETVAGNNRLLPRGSFQTYLQQVSNRCTAWSEQDIYFTRHIWTLVNSAERRAPINKLTSQQSLMINELNHRVRNILALVRSVSSQARRRYGSLNSYAKSLEARIEALASAHDIASGSTVSAVELKRLILLEVEPYEKGVHIEVEGPEHFLRADIAPIVSLIIHELATNAAKYGALSVEAGAVSITVKDDPDGISITWCERNGPEVVEPAERGFGSALIEQAVPHELGGKAQLRFKPKGVEAELFLPDAVLTMAPPPTVSDRQPSAPITEVPLLPFSAQGLDGAVMIVEDNFIIAKEMNDQLEDFGFADVVTYGNLADAMEFLETEQPIFAVLDVNLGSGLTSEPVALRLIEMGTPLIFVTGYGDRAELPGPLRHIPCLTKPVTTTELQNALARMVPVHD